MARITVYDCLEHIPNRFELTLLAAFRARQFGDFVDASPADKGHNRTVAALREIARGDIDVNKLRRDLIQSYQHQLPDASPDPVEIGEDKMLLKLIEAKTRDRADIERKGI